jgi:hypothetical protein
MQSQQFMNHQGTSYRICDNDEWDETAASAIVPPPHEQ